MWQRNVRRHRVGTLGMYLAILICAGLVSGCATYYGAVSSGEEAVNYEATAREYFDQGRYEEAEKYITMAIEKFEESVRKCSMALDCYLKKDPAAHYAYLYTHRASSRLLLKKYTLAMQDARRAIGYDESNAFAHYVLGYCSAEIGDLDTARRELAILESLNKKLASHLDTKIASVKRAGLKKLRPEEIPLRMSEEPRGDLTTFIKKK